MDEIIAEDVASAVHLVVESIPHIEDVVVLHDNVGRVIHPNANAIAAFRCAMEARDPIVADEHVGCLPNAHRLPIPAIRALPSDQRVVLDNRAFNAIGRAHDFNRAVDREPIDGHIITMGRADDVRVRALKDDGISRVHHHGNPGICRARHGRLNRWGIPISKTANIVCSGLDDHRIAGDC